MATMKVLETAERVCKSPVCRGATTKQDLIELVIDDKPPVREWVCTKCHIRIKAASPTPTPTPTKPK